MAFAGNGCLHGSKRVFYFWFVKLKAAGDNVEDSGVGVWGSVIDKVTSITLVFFEQQQG